MNIREDSRVPMPAIAMKWAACKLMAWCAARSSTQRLFPLVAPILRRHLDALLHDAQGAVILSAVALVALLYAVRSA